MPRYYSGPDGFQVLQLVLRAIRAESPRLPGRPADAHVVAYIEHLTDQARCWEGLNWTVADYHLARRNAARDAQQRAHRVTWRLPMIRAYMQAFGRESAPYADDFELEDWQAEVEYNVEVVLEALGGSTNRRLNPVLEKLQTWLASARFFSN